MKIELASVQIQSDDSVRALEHGPMCGIEPIGSRAAIGGVNEIAGGVDDNRLARHRVCAAHRHRRVGAVVLVGGFSPRQPIGPW